MGLILLRIRVFCLVVHLWLRTLIHFSNQFANVHWRKISLLFHSCFLFFPEVGGTGFQFLLLQSFAYRGIFCTPGASKSRRIQIDKCPQKYLHCCNKKSDFGRKISKSALQSQRAKNSVRRFACKSLTVPSLSSLRGIGGIHLSE